MRCFYHPDTEAVGLCKSCSKGICPDCAVDMDGGLACQNRCEENVRTLNKLIVRNKLISKKMHTSYLLLGSVFMLLGGGLIITFLSERNLYNSTNYSTLFGGTAFIALSLFLLKRAWDMKKANAPCK